MGKGGLMLPNWDAITWWTAAGVAVTAAPFISWLLVRVWGHFVKVTKALNSIIVIGNEFTNDNMNDNKTFKQIIREFAEKLAEIEVSVLVTTAKTRIIADSLNLATWTATSDGAAIWASRKLLELYGLPFESIQGNGWRVAIVDEDRERVTREWERAVDESRMFRQVYTIISTSGTRTKVLSVAEPVATISGQIISFVGTLQVLT
jgi:PAS domain S-box-containing protein